MNIFNQFKLKKKQNPQAGMSMLFAILVVSTTLVVSLGVGGLMLAELRSAQAFDDSEKSYYASEVGIEKALYLIKQDSEYRTESEKSTLENNAKYEYTVISGEGEIEESLIKDDSFQMNLFDSDDQGAAFDIRRAEITWDLGEEFEGSKANPWLEITKISWRRTEPIDFSGSPEGHERVEKQIVSHEEAPANIEFDSGYNYRLRIKALYNGADLKLKAYDKENEQVNFPTSLVKITSIGKYANSGRGIEVTAQQGSQLLGVFDYVLYSEEEVSR